MTTRYTVEFFSRRGSLHHAEETKTLASAKRVLRDSKFGGRAIDQTTGTVAYVVDQHFETLTPAATRGTSAPARWPGRMGTQNQVNP
jgi:hypothetical protein